MVDKNSLPLKMYKNKFEIQKYSENYFNLKTFNILILELNKHKMKIQKTLL